MGYPCYLVDDGSEAHCERLLQDLAAGCERVVLQRLHTNQGKGAAVCAGLRLAGRAGYTHVLQIDADGQHQLNDIKKFFAESAANPHNVVTGVRISRNSPRGRYYGRAITDLWVWINTLSFQIKDSMCGFRVYPLSDTLRLLDHTSVGRRMNFDTDILVRLYWSGLNISQISTEVTYLDDVPSHFDMFADNIRISLMHSRLFFGMIARAPGLIKRHFHKDTRRA
jgi:glycosyltransferase involved in cell wall biosynthesis